MFSQGNLSFSSISAVRGAISLRQAFLAWQSGVNLVDYAKEHHELKGAFETFADDADRIYPEWRKKLGL